MKVLLLFKPEAKLYGITRLKFNCDVIAHAAFIILNYEDHCTNVFITKTNETKPFIEGFDAFNKWYTDNTIFNDPIKKVTKKRIAKL